MLSAYITILLWTPGIHTSISAKASKMHLAPAEPALLDVRFAHNVNDSEVLYKQFSSEGPIHLEERPYT